MLWWVVVVVVVVELSWSGFQNRSVPRQLNHLCTEAAPLPDKVAAEQKPSRNCGGVGCEAADEDMR